MIRAFSLNPKKNRDRGFYAFADYKPPTIGR